MSDASLSPEDLFATQPELERQDGETMRAHEAFMDYCLMGGGRSLAKLAAVYQKRAGDESTVSHPPTVHLRTLENWSIRNNWQERLTVYSQARSRLQRHIEAEEIRQMSKRHASLGTALQNAAVDLLTGLDGSTMTINEMLRALELGVRIEREARGEAPELEIVSRGGARVRYVEVEKPPDADEDLEGWPDED